ncbi:MAG: hypothetical protein ACYSWP_07045 [Planctomycetota bacterium]|jgi:hypothetical protein
MKPADEIKNLFDKTNLTTNPQKNKNTLNKILQAQQNTIDSRPTPGKPNLWRIIPKSKITKLTTAAGLIIAVFIGIVIVNELAVPAYAIEQTIKALQEISTVHVIGTDWDGRRFESWNKINPETGKAEWVCIDQTPHGYKIASTPKGSCVWDKDGNVIRYSNHAIASNDFKYERVFEDLSNRMKNPSDEEKISIYRKKDPVTGKDAIVIRTITKMQDFRVYVDPTTKLPIRTYYDRADNMQQICKTVDQIFYNVELPEGMFDFEIPDIFVRDYSVLEDPNKGMPAEGLTHDQASVLIAQKYWKAAISGDWDTCQQMAPIDQSWKTGFRKNPPVELIETRQPYPQRGCTGLIVPCVVKYADGKVFESKPIVNYREIEGRTSVIIVAYWGKREQIQ